MSVGADLKPPLFVALDVDSDAEALRLARATREFVGGFKVGPRLCLRYGARLIEDLHEIGPVFVDNKHLDIPSTMVAAVRASFDLGATFCTVHAQAGSAALEALAKLEADLNQTRPFRILAVTILTSFTPETLPPNANQRSITDQTERLATAVIESGLSGLVCSPSEVQTLREKFPQSWLVTPGVRLGRDAIGDQARVAEPREALARGASALVVGRPIVQSPQPAAAARAYYEEIKDILPSTR